MAERPEDLNLPNSIIAKIIKDSLPTGVIVSKDARLAISKAASVFVLYATSCANNFAMQHKRKTISATDVFEAMLEMDFEQFIEPLKKNLEAYKSGQKGRKEASEKRKKDKDSTNQDGGAAGGQDGEEEEEEEDEEGAEGNDGAGAEGGNEDDDEDDEIL